MVLACGKKTGTLYMT